MSGCLDGISCNNYEVARILIDKIKEIISEKHGEHSTMNFTQIDQMAAEEIDDEENDTLADQIRYR